MQIERDLSDAATQVMPMSAIDARFRSIRPLRNRATWPSRDTLVTLISVVTLALVRAFFDAPSTVSMRLFMSVDRFTLSSNYKK